MSTAASFCRNCGKALTEEEKAIDGNIVCAACAPAPQPDPAVSPDAPAPPPPPKLQPPPYAPPPGYNPNAPSPGLAFLLGLIPGVGAIYNGQYAKGLVHVFILGLLITIADHHGSSREFGPIFPMMCFAFWAYMAFEAYHTARHRAQGEPVDEFSSLVSMNPGHRSITAPAALIVVGVIFLLNNLEVLRLSQILRFWPVGLIVLGAYMLYARLHGTPPQPGPFGEEYRHE
jgi:hypothetical protein